jgi:hypothetical protein
MPHLERDAPEGTTCGYHIGLSTPLISPERRLAVPPYG